MKKLNKKGFTIVELVIVIAVIAILAAVLIPTFSNVISNSKDSAALSDAKTAYQATIIAELNGTDTDDDVTTATDEAGESIYVKVDNDRIVKISFGEEPELVESTPDGGVEYEIENGKLVKVTA